MPDDSGSDATRSGDHLHDSGNAGSGNQERRWEFVSGGRIGPGLMDSSSKTQDDPNSNLVLNEKEAEIHKNLQKDIAFAKLSDEELKGKAKEIFAKLRRDVDSAIESSQRAVQAKLDAKDPRDVSALMNVADRTKALLQERVQSRENPEKIDEGLVGLRVKPVRITHITGPNERVGTGDVDFTAAHVEALKQMNINTHYLHGLTDLNILQDEIINRITASQTDAEHILHLQFRIRILGRGTGIIVLPETLKAFKEQGNKVVITCHEFIQTRSDAKAQTVEYLQHADRIVFTTSSECNAFLDYVDSHPELHLNRNEMEKRSEVIWGSTTIPVEQSIVEGAERRPPNLICFGSIHSEKRYDKAINLAEMIKNDWRLALMKELCKARDNELDRDALSTVAKLYYAKEKTADPDTNIGDPSSEELGRFIHLLSQEDIFEHCKNAVREKNYDMAQFDPKIIIVGGIIDVETIEIIVNRMFGETSKNIKRYHKELKESIRKVLSESEGNIPDKRRKAVTRKLRQEAGRQRFEFLSTAWHQLRRDMLSDHIIGERDTERVAEPDKHGQECVTEGSIRDLFTLKHQLNSPVWNRFFVDTVTQYLMQNVTDPADIPQERLDWVTKLMDGKSQRDQLEQQLLEKLQKLRLSLSQPEGEQEFRVKWRNMKKYVVKEGKIMELGITNLKVLLELEDPYGRQGISQKDVDDLWRIKEEMKGLAFHPSWKELFVETLARYILEGVNRPDKIDQERMGWLREKLGSSTNSNDFDKILLQGLDNAQAGKYFRDPTLPVELRVNVPAEQLADYFGRSRYALQFINGRGITPNSGGCANSIAYGSIIFGPVTEQTPDELAQSVVDAKSPQQALDKLVERMLNPELDKPQRIALRTYREKSSVETSAARYKSVYERVTTGEIRHIPTMG